MEIRTLNSRWINLFKNVAEETFLQDCFAELLKNYSEKHRHYHSIAHIADCLSALDKIKTHLNDRFSIEVAIWFHDIIYDPKQSKNEKLSAEYAKAILRDIKIDLRTISNIEHLINLTKHPSKPITSDEKYLIDIDLLILGSNSESFNIYETNIRKEYSFVPNFLYKKGRGKLLKDFLNSKRIYQTDYFFDIFEKRARINIEKALASLKGS